MQIGRAKWQSTTDHFLLFMVWHCKNVVFLLLLFCAWCMDHSAREHDMDFELLRQLDLWLISIMMSIGKCNLWSNLTSISWFTILIDRLSSWWFTLRTSSSRFNITSAVYLFSILLFLLFKIVHDILSLMFRSLIITMFYVSETCLISCYSFVCQMVFYYIDKISSWTILCLATSLW